MSLLSSMKGQGWADIIEELHRQADNPAIKSTTVDIEGLILEGPPAKLLQKVTQSRDLSFEKTLDLICSEIGDRLVEANPTKEQTPAFLDQQYELCCAQARKEAEGKSSSVKGDVEELMKQLKVRLAKIQVQADKSYNQTHGFMESLVDIPELMSSQKHTRDEVNFRILPPIQPEDLIAVLHRRLAEYGKGYPDCWKNVDNILSKKSYFSRPDHPGWPRWCYMPFQAYEAYNPLNMKDQMSSRTIANDFLTLAAWRQSKNLFRYDVSLMEELWDTPITGKIPTELFQHLPDYSVLIMLPEGAIAEASGAQAAICQMTKVGQYPSMCINFIDVTNQMSGVVVFPLLDTLEDSFQFVLNTFDTYEGGKADEITPVGTSTFYESNAFARTVLTKCERDVRGLMSMLLYLCSEQPDVESRLGNQLPEKPKPQIIKGTPRWFAAQQSTVWDVGLRIGAVIRHSLGPRPEPLGGTHKTPRPHVRNSHWHTYWTCQGRTQAKVKWVFRTIVNAGLGEPVDTIRPVQRGLK